MFHPAPAAGGSVIGHLAAAREAALIPERFERLSHKTPRARSLPAWHVSDGDTASRTGHRGADAPPRALQAPRSRSDGLRASATGPEQHSDRAESAFGVAFSSAFVLFRRAVRRGGTGLRVGRCRLPDQSGEHDLAAMRVPQADRDRGIAGPGRTSCPGRRKPSLGSQSDPPRAYADTEHHGAARLTPSSAQSAPGTIRAGNFSAYSPGTAMPPRGLWAAHRPDQRKRA